MRGRWQGVEQVCDFRDQFIGVEVDFDKVVAHAERARTLNLYVFASIRDDNDWEIGEEMLSSERLEDSEPIYARQAHIEKHEVRLDGAYEPQPFSAIEGDFYRIAMLLELMPDEPRQYLLVFDEDDGLSFGLHT